MSRDIKFRAWVKKGGAMASWKDIIQECDRLSFLKDDNFEIMQYTGLKDKNGVEIYEGDLITNAGGRIAEVTWHPYTGAWDCECRKTTRSDSSYGFECSRWASLIHVIGNIHENGELLEL